MPTSPERDDPSKPEALVTVSNWFHPNFKPRSFKGSLRFFNLNGILLLTSILVLSACGGAAPQKEAQRDAPQPSPSQAPAHADWSYAGENGPEHWGDLDPAYAACVDGQRQSPINLVNASQEDMANIAFHYQPTETRILNNGHTVQVNYDPGSYIEFDGQRYDLAQFHFHTPSEHAVDGERYPAELHLVHKNALGQLAVVAVFLEEGDENLALKPVWDHLPATEQPATATGTSINAGDFLPAGHTTYRYDGSLTTPPCTEGVTWLLMTEPVTLSEAQITSLQDVIHENARPLQVLNGRELRIDSTP